jgi:hypothetical protein
MSYLLIKKDDVKTFKSFLSGNEIEVGVRVDSRANVFPPNAEVYVFYGNDDDTYKARITRQERPSGNTSLLLLGVVKDSHPSTN